LLLACLLGVVVQILEVIPLSHTTLRPGAGWQGACSAFGFLEEVTLWMSNFFIIWIVGYLCWLMKQPEHRVNMFISPVSVPEAVCICMCFFLPFTFNWLPFTTEYYGPSGNWCWIKLTKSDDCNDTDIRQAAFFIFTFHYGPLVLIMFVSTLIAVAALITWCKSLNTSDPLLFIAVYPILLNLAGSIVTANRIEDLRRLSSNLPPNYPLWVAYAVADPLRICLPASLFLLQLLFPTTREMVVRCRRPEQESIDGQVLTAINPKLSSDDSETKPLVTEPPPLHSGV
jgi:hypothetical protein